MFVYLFLVSVVLQVGADTSACPKGSDSLCVASGEIVTSLKREANATCRVSEDCATLSCDLPHPLLGPSAHFNMTMFPCGDTPHVDVYLYAFEQVVLSQSVSDMIHINGSHWAVVLVLEDQTFGASLAFGMTVDRNQTAVVRLVDSVNLCCPSQVCDTSREKMCSSLYSLRNQTLSSPGTAGSCSVSDDCTSLSCSLTVSYSGFQVPLSLKTTLHPCSVPYKVHLAVSSPLLGEVVNDDFTESRTITISVFGTNADVIVTLTQQCFGVTISNAVLIGGSRLDFISPTNISMFCDRTTSITMATSTMSMMSSIPMATAYIPATTTPTPTSTTTPTAPPLRCVTSKEEMCSSLYSLRNQTLSSPGTAGSCSVSDDCTSLSCSLTVSYSGFQVPLSLMTTLHPCSVPYKVHLAVSSPLLGEVVNDDFTESRTITISVFGASADVIVTLTQQCFGVTISNAVLIGDNRLDFISPTNISMFCDRTTSITMATSTMSSIPMTTAYIPATTTPTPTSTTTPTAPPLRCVTSKEEMCSSLYSLRNQTLSSPGTAGSCSVSDDCTSLSCSLTVSYSGFQVPLSLKTTLHPCSVPYKVHLAVSSPLLGEVVNDDFTESRTITISVFGTNADVIVTLTQQCFGVTISNAVLIGGNRLDFISPTNISMFCDRTTSITMATSTMSMMSSIPMTTAYIPTTATPTTTPISIPTTTPTTTPTAPPLPCDTSREEMCSSLYSLRNQTLSSPGTAGSCSVSDDCTSLSCSLTVSYSGFQVPLSLKTTLHPCSVPYKVHLAVSSPLLGEVVNDDFTESRTITISVFGTSADVIVTLTQQCFGVTISNAVLIGGNRLDFISPTNISMFCDRTTSITMATSTMLSVPMTTAYIPVTTIPTTTPTTTPTAPPLPCDTSKEEMCLSLYSLRNQTLSSPGTAGSCSVSDDCTSLSCSLTVSYSGFQVPLSLKTTLHPCSVPYKVHLAVSSSLLGEVVNDDFTESRTITISVFGTSADVIVTLTQQCFGVTISNAVLIGGNRLDFISPTNISMFCDRTTSITVATSTTSMMSSIPMTTAYIPTTTTPTPTTTSTPTTTPISIPTTTPTAPPLPCDTSKEEMCSSLYSLRNQTLSSPGTAGSCSVSDDCTSLSCSLTVSYSGFQVPLSLKTTLHPCSVPYKVHLAVSSPLLGEVVNDDFTESRTITISVFGASADVIVILTQQCFGVTISNAVLIGGNRLDFISPTNISMFCDRTTSITMATSTMSMMSSIPMTTAYIPTTTTPTTTPTTTFMPSPSLSPSPSPSLPPTPLPLIDPYLLYIYIGIAVSIGCAGLCTIVVLLLWLLGCCKRGPVYTLGRVRQPIHCCLCLTIILSMVAFILGHLLAKADLHACRVASGFIFYFSLSSVFWLVCDAGLLAYMVTKAVVRAPLLSYILIVIVGLVLPVIPVLVTSMLNPDNIIVRTDTDTRFCWVSWKDATVYGVIAPLVGASLVGVLYLVLIVRGILCVKTGHAHFADGSGDNNDKIEEPIKSNSFFSAFCQLVLFFTLPLVWIFALLFVNNTHDPQATAAFGVLFAITAIVQGVFLILLTVFGHRELWMLLCCCFGDSQGDRRQEYNAQLWEPTSAETTGKKISDNGKEFVTLEKVTNGQSKAGEGQEEQTEITDNDVEAAIQFQTSSFTQQSNTAKIGGDSDHDHSDDIKGGSYQNLKFSTLMFPHQHEQSKSAEDVTMTTKKPEDVMTPL